MNKFDAINKVLMSNIKPENKPLLIELIMRADDEGKCWPSVERLCKARGIKHYKNFKGADYYLPGLVTKVKQGRKNIYYINTPALEGLLDAEVTSKYNDSPAVEGVYNPAGEGVLEVNTPATADNTPAVEGPNSTTNNTTIDNTEESTSKSPVSDEPVDSTSNFVVRRSMESTEVAEVMEDEGTSLNLEEQEDSLNSTETDPKPSENKSMNRFKKVFEYNRQYNSGLTTEWDAVWKFMVDDEYLPNQQDPAERLYAASKRVNEMEWAKW